MCRDKRDNVLTVFVDDNILIKKRFRKAMFLMEGNLLVVTKIGIFFGTRGK